MHDKIDKLIEEAVHADKPVISKEAMEKYRTSSRLSDRKRGDKIAENRSQMARALLEKRRDNRRYSPPGTPGRGMGMLGLGGLGLGGAATIAAMMSGEDPEVPEAVEAPEVPEVPEVPDRFAGFPGGEAGVGAASGLAVGGLGSLLYNKLKKK